MNDGGRLVGSRLDYCNSLLAVSNLHDSIVGLSQKIVSLTFLHFSLPTACSKYTCSGRSRNLSFLPHHARSFWFALASCSPQNKFQECNYHIQGPVVPTAILSHRPYFTVCADTITTIFFLVNMCFYTKNRSDKVQIIFICCPKYLE